MLAEIIIFVIFLLLFAYYNRTRRWQKFQSRGIPYSVPYFPFGSIHNWKALFSDKGNSSEAYRAYLGTDLMKEKVFGAYGHVDRDEVLLINDIDIAKRMLIKDFDHFVDRTDLGLKFDHSKIGDRIFANMFMFQKGDMWKTQRSLMSPVFTTGKLKLMYPLLLKVSKQLEKYVAECAEKNEEMICKEAFTRFSLDAIATSAFGIEVDTFAEPNSVFKKMINEILRAPGSEAGSNWEMFKLIITFTIPICRYFFYVEQFSSKAMGFLQNALLKTIEMRRNGTLKRNDIIDLVIEQAEARKSKSGNQGDTEIMEDDEYDKAASLDMSNVKNLDLNMDETLVSNAFGIFVASLDTTSSTLTFAVHFLMKFPHFQEKIRDEISEVIGDDDNITFEQIQNLKYLEKFLLETLRNAHPFGQILERECTKDYLIPGTNYTVRKGEIVNFTLLYEKTKNNPENTSFYNPGEFDPENFNPSNNPDSFGFLGFGQGPRNCVGKRYAILAMKLALVHVLRNHKIVKSKNTKEDLKLYKFIAGAEVPFYAQKI